MVAPTVSIFCITYNQQDFINDCIDSVLKQETSFDWVLLINDDNSTDNTADICRIYQEQYSGKIIFSSNSENLGLNKNMFLTYQKCIDTGSKYVAQVAGDDYWIDPFKLQKQFDFMELHPEVALCYTNAYAFFNGNEGQKEIMIKENPKQNVFDLEYYISKGCFLIPALTIFFRNDAFPQPVPDFICQAFNSDWALNILFMQKGKAAYMDEITAMYRRHRGGITSSTSLSSIIHNGIALSKNLDKHFNYKYHHVFGKTQQRYHRLILFYFEKKKYIKGLYWLFFSFFRNPLAFFADTYFLKTLYKVTFTGHEV